MDENRLSEDNPFKDLNETEAQRLDREHFDTLLRIEQKLDIILSHIDHNSVRLNLIQEVLPQLPAEPIEFRDLKFNHDTSTLWADERFFIKFDGKQAALIARLFYKNGNPKRARLKMNALIKESYDYATDTESDYRVFYNQANEVKKKIDKDFRTPQLFVVTTDEIYFHHE